MRFILAFSLLLIAFAVQFWTATFGISLDLALAALFGFALVFDWAELLFFAAFTVLVIDWRPLLSAPLLTYVCLPLLLFGFRRIFNVSAWLCLLVAVALGVAALALAAGPALALAYGGMLLADIAIGFGFALLSFFVLGHFS